MRSLPMDLQSGYKIMCNRWTGGVHWSGKYLAILEEARHRRERKKYTITVCKSCSNKTVNFQQLPS